MFFSKAASRSFSLPPDYVQIIITKQFRVSRRQLTAHDRLICLTPQFVPLVSVRQT